MNSSCSRSQSRPSPLSGLELDQVIVQAVNGARIDRLPVVAESVGRDQADPKPEGPRPAVVIEAAQFRARTSKTSCARSSASASGVSCWSNQRRISGA